MAKASFTKTSWESWVIAGNFTKDLESGETIVLATSTVTATDSDGVAAPSVLDQSYKAVSGGYLQIRVQAGTDGEVYTIEFKAITSLSNKFELEIEMKVKD